MSRPVGVKQRRWTPEDTRAVLDLMPYGIQGDNDGPWGILAHRLGRTAESIRAKAYLLRKRQNSVH